MEKKSIVEEKKNPLEGIIDPEKIKIALEFIKKYRAIVRDFFGNKEHERTVIVVGASISLCVLGYSIIQMIQQNQTLAKETNNLERLDRYSMQILRDGVWSKNIGNTAVNIADLLKVNEDIKEETKRYEEHKTELQSSYTNFLQYFLVPKLNIRKEAYTDKINLSLVWENFLEQNPFNDINLYQKWSNFFSSTEKNQVNTIENLEIGDITETEYGLYGIKISFSFVTPSKNALLFLADKISISSDKENISLLWEFVYYLRQQIKNDKVASIEKLKADPNNKEIAANDDKIIWKELYKWVYGEEGSPLIDDKTINKTIKNIMECGTENESECFYKFRDKFRNIAEIAYTIGSESNISKTDDLKMFFKNMPPLMTVDSFTFDQKESNQLITSTTTYEGRIELSIYGQNISVEEIADIGRALGKKCLGNEEWLSPELAIAVIEKNGLTQKGKEENSNSISRISDLKLILEDISKEYIDANNYKKTIRLFEIYRMLNEGGFCTTI